MKKGRTRERERERERDEVEFKRSGDREGG